jgi:hypothetical protein
MLKRHEQAHDDEGRVDPVDTFLAQPDFVEEPGLDGAALERERLLRLSPNPDAIVIADALLNEHHPNA